MSGANLAESFSDSSKFEESLVFDENKDASSPIDNDCVDDKAGIGIDAAAVMIVFVVKFGLEFDDPIDGAKSSNVEIGGIVVGVGAGVDNGVEASIWTNTG